MKCSTFSSEIGSSINASSSKTPPQNRPTATLRAADPLSGDVLVPRSPSGIGAIPNSQGEDVFTSQPTLDAPYSRHPAAVNTESLVEDSYKDTHLIDADLNDHQSLSAVIPGPATPNFHLARKAPGHNLTASANHRRPLDMAPQAIRTSTSKYNAPSSGQTLKPMPGGSRTSRTPANASAPTGFSSQQVLKRKRAARIASDRTSMIDEFNLAVESPATKLRDSRSFNTLKLSADNAHDDPAALECATLANRPASIHKNVQELGFSTRVSIGNGLKPEKMNGKTSHHALDVPRTMMRSLSKSSNISKQDAFTTDQRRGSHLAAKENTSKPTNKTASKVRHADIDSNLWDLPVSPKTHPKKSIATSNGRRTVAAKKRKGTAGRKSGPGLVEQDESDEAYYINKSVQPPPIDRRTTRASGKFEPLLELGQSNRKPPQKQMEGGGRTRPLPEANVPRHKTSKVLDSHEDPATESIEAFEASMTREHDGRSDEKPLTGSEQELSFDIRTGRDHECEVAPTNVMEDDALTLPGLKQALAAAEDHAGDQQLYFGQSKPEPTRSISADRLSVAAANSHDKRKDHATSQNPIVLSDNGTEDTDCLSFTSERVEGGNVHHTPQARSSPPVSCDTRRSHERTMPIKDDLRAAERALSSSKPQMIHFSQDGPKNQGVLSKKSTFRYTGNDRESTMLDATKRQHLRGSAEEAMAEILGSGVKEYGATPFVPKTRDPAQRNMLSNQPQSLKTMRQLTRTPLGALMPPPSLRSDGHRNAASKVAKARTARDVSSSNEAEIMISGTVGTFTKHIYLGTLSVPSKRSLPPAEAENKESLSSKRFKIMADAMPPRQPLSPLHTVSPANAQCMIQNSVLDKLARSHKSVSLSRNVDCSPKPRAPTSANYAGVAKMAMSPSGAALQRPSEVDTIKRATGTERAPLNKLSGKDSSQRPPIMLEGERRDIFRKSSQPRVTEDGSPVRQEQEERYTQQQQDIGETSEDELKGIDSADLSLTTRDALRKSGDDTDLESRLTVPLVDVDAFDDSTSSASEDCSQIIYSGLDHNISDEIVGQHNPLTIPEEDPFLMPKRYAAKPCSEKKEQCQARLNDKSLLETLKFELLRVRQTQAGPAECEGGGEETDLEKTLVEDVDGSVQSANSALPSQSSDQSRIGSLKSERIVGITNVMHGLGVHRRPLYQSITRIGHELVRHLVDTETAIKDSIDDYFKDGTRLLEQMEISHMERLDSFVLDAKTIERHLHRDFEITARRLEEDVKAVEASHKQYESKNGEEDDALEELDALLEEYQ